MSIEAVWVIKLLMDDINAGNFYTKTFSRFEESQSAIAQNASRPLSYPTFPAGIINHVECMKNTNFKILI